ncbi:hypothetical protein I7I53_07447 [Histoplasma capsulatum var. duboisii H88]|uniref:Uncharacterized protein n=1 Tax=Ajellomyces capsulatus (strain H88) TaxID=544711 RepID=A0A8A1LGB1_AJEC8|nr:hypothetical protein I7I53_07447 [Histoplasma capsulatum var. duboisii H88]
MVIDKITSERVGETSDQFSCPTKHLTHCLLSIPKSLSCFWNVTCCCYCYRCTVQRTAFVSHDEPSVPQNSLEVSTQSSGMPDGIFHCKIISTPLTHFCCYRDCAPR